MPEPLPVESPKPFTNLLAGIAIPAAAVAACAVAGAGLALALGVLDRNMLWGAAALGAVIGLFASFYGIAELLLAFFFSGGPGLNRRCRALGYLAAWAAAVLILIWYRS